MLAFVAVLGRAERRGIVQACAVLMRDVAEEGVSGCICLPDMLATARDLGGVVCLLARVRAERRLP